MGHIGDVKVQLPPRHSPKGWARIDARYSGTPGESTKLDTFGGRIEVLWDPRAEVTALGALAFFSQFLRTSGLGERWMEECRLADSIHKAAPNSRG
jgi:hypothetical protein